MTSAMFLRSSTTASLLMHRSFATARVSSPLTRPTPVLSLLSQSRTFRTFSPRYEASKVSSQPGSASLPHATQNIKEETSAIASTVAKSIAGSGGKGDYDAAAITREMGGNSKVHTEGVKEDFINITSSIANTVPKHILNFGLIGALPYLGTSLTTLYLARQASMSAQGLIASPSVENAIAMLESCSHVQVTYGAVMLSFLGALHWGMEFSKFGGYQGYPRLALGVAPLLVAWPTLAMEPQMALVAQWFGFTLLWYADMKATSAGWTPTWYSQYRFYLSILVGTCILGTLFGLNYLGPTTDVVLSKNLQMHEGAIGSSVSFMEGVVKGEVDRARGTGKDGQKKFAVPEGAEFWTEEGEDGYVRIVKKASEEEEEGEGEGDDAEGDEEGDEKPKEKKSKAKGEGEEASSGDDDGEAESSDDDKEKEKSNDDSDSEPADSDADSEGDDDAEPDSKDAKSKPKPKKDSPSGTSDNADKGHGGPDDNATNEKVKKQAKDTKDAQGGGDKKKGK